MARGHDKGWQLNLRININHSVQLLSSDSFPHHGLQYTRLPCPSSTPGACSNSIELVMPSNHLILCHPLLLLLSISPSIRVFSNESVLRIRWPNIGASAAVLPMNIQGWFSLELTGLISMLSKGLLRVFSSTRVQKHQFFSAQPFLWFKSHMTTGKAMVLAIGTFVGKLMSLAV